MNSTPIREGDLVKVTYGPYNDAVGVVSDIMEECSVIRVHSKNGNVYAYADAVRVLVVPRSIDRQEFSKELVRVY